MTRASSRTAYFEAHDAVAVQAVLFATQRRKVARLLRRLSTEQAVLAVMELQLTDLLVREETERVALSR